MQGQFFGRNDLLSFSIDLLGDGHGNLARFRALHLNHLRLQLLVLNLLHLLLIFMELVILLFAFFLLLNSLTS